MKIVAKARAIFAQGGLLAGKWALIAFAVVAAFALAVQALALVLAALALLVIALCLATVCMPQESRAVWAWMRDTLCRWSAVAGADAAAGGTSVNEQPAKAESAGPESAGPESAESKTAGPEFAGPESATAAKQAM